jgi:hypothetical protein
MLFWTFNTPNVTPVAREIFILPTRMAQKEFCGYVNVLKGTCYLLQRQLGLFTEVHFQMWLGSMVWKMDFYMEKGF